MSPVERADDVEPGLGRLTYVGAVLTAVLAVLAVLTNVVVPGGPTGSDGDSANEVAILRVSRLRERPR